MEISVYDSGSISGSTTTFIRRKICCCRINLLFCSVLYQLSKLLLLLLLHQTFVLFCFELPIQSAAGAIYFCFLKNPIDFCEPPGHPHPRLAIAGCGFLVCTAQLVVMNECFDRLFFLIVLLLKGSVPRHKHPLRSSIQLVFFCGFA